MNKHDYNFIATAFYEQRLAEHTTNNQPGIDTLNRLAHRLAHMLGDEDLTGFNRQQFLQACGLTQKEI